MAKIGFIGMGNMGSAMLKGLLKNGEYCPQDLVFTDADHGKAGKISRETGVSSASSNAECAAQAVYLVLAVKPQYYDGVLEEIKEVVKPEQILISIAPGITISQLKAKLGEDKRIVRAMPNTPALCGEGMTGVCYDKAVLDENEQAVIKGFFESFGKMRLVEERLISAVACVSGSSPAYVYMFIEALADGAVKYGLPRDAAYEMAAQTLIGSAKMVLETGEHPGRLKDMVCSPGGTTIAAVGALEEYGFRNAVIKAADACYEKCESIK